MSNWETAVCIDFDGVIHGYSKGWQGGAIYDEPKKGALLGLFRLTKAGYKVYVLTARSEEDFPKITKYLTDNALKLPLDEGYTAEMVKVLNGIEVTNIKKPARAYVDDRAIRFENDWDSIINYFI